MDATFCPRCETELLREPRVCPACGYNESIDAAPAAPVDVTPYTERYHGPAPAAAGGLDRSAASNRTRLMVVAALLAVATLYTSLMIVSDMRAHAGANGPAATRMVTRP